VGTLVRASGFPSWAGLTAEEAFHVLDQGRTLLIPITCLTLDCKLDSHDRDHD
jgi:hypothetical protein